MAPLDLSGDPNAVKQRIEEALCAARVLARRKASVILVLAFVAADGAVVFT